RLPTTWPPCLRPGPCGASKTLPEPLPRPPGGRRAAADRADGDAGHARRTGRHSSDPPPRSPRGPRPALPVMTNEHGRRLTRDCLIIDRLVVCLPRAYEGTEAIEAGRADRAARRRHHREVRARGSGTGGP